MMTHTGNGVRVQASTEEAMERLSERLALANELMGALAILLVAVILLVLVKANAPF